MMLRIHTGDPHTDTLIRAAAALWETQLASVFGQDGTLLVISDTTADTLPRTQLEEADGILVCWHRESWLGTELHRDFTEHKIYAALPLPVHLPDWEKAILALSGRPAPQPETPSLQLIPEENLVRCGQKSVRLTDREFRLLTVLQEHRGQVVSTDTLTGTVWPDGVEGNACQVHMTHLRRKLIPLAGEGVLTGIRGKGYILR